MIRFDQYYCLYGNVCRNTETESHFQSAGKDERFALTSGTNGNVQLTEHHEEENSQKWWIE
ncbi:MAG: hypothetical protein K2G51_07325 [Lachnospiraceae bacterium]|nr:hypothetical protein [Lachnospiraceae bacterium]